MSCKLLLPSILTAAVIGSVFPSATAFADVYELRIYKANEGKLDALNARFRDHTVRLFKKHGIESVGYWVPVDDPKPKGEVIQKPENVLIYIIKHESRDAAKASWKAFLADPDWKKAAAESGVGRLASRPISIYMDATDYSPTWSNGESDADAVFELRIYKAAEGKLGKLDARFRDHTIDIFRRHGMNSVGYWHPNEDQEDSEDKLIYIIRHDSRDAAKASWKAFGADPDWHKARDASGVGSLAKRPDSIYMRATDYSAIK